MKKTLILLLALVLLLSVLAGCGKTNQPATTPSASPTNNNPASPASPTSPASPSAPAPPAVGGDIVLGPPAANAKLAEHINLITETNLTILNPFLLAGTAGPAQKASYLVHDRLVQQPAPGVIAPQLATRWETDDYKTFVFYLRENAYFHNGDHFTAEDVIWNIEMAKSRPGCPALTRWGSVDTARALDKYTVEIVLNRSNVDFLFDLAEYYAVICSRGAHALDPDGSEWGLIGTGPFKVTGFSSNDFLTVERFDKFWGDPPPTKSMTFWTIPEQATRTVMLQTGEAQVAFSLSPEDLDMFNKSDDFTVYKLLVNEPVGLCFNNQGDATMMDLNFRLAVAHAVNAADVATVAFGNWGEAPWDGSFWGPITQYRLNGFQKREYNPSLAKEYLAKSCYNGETIELLTSLPSNIRAVEVVQLQLEAIGISVKVEIMDIAGFLEVCAYNPKRTDQLHLFTVGMTPVASQTLKFTYYPGINTNRLNLNNDRLTKLIDQLDASIDVKEREKIAHEIQQIFYDDIPAITMFWRYSTTTTVNGIGGMKLTSDPFNQELRGLYWDLDKAPANLRP